MMIYIVPHIWWKHVTAHMLLDGWNMRRLIIVARDSFDACWWMRYFIIIMIYILILIHGVYMICFSLIFCLCLIDNMLFIYDEAMNLLLLIMFGMMDVVAWSLLSWRERAWWCSWRGHVFIVIIIFMNLMDGLNDDVDVFFATYDIFRCCCY